MRTIFDKLSDAYAKYYSPAEHLAVDEIIVLFKGREEGLQTEYTKETQTFWDKNLQAM
jgi:hypothetical protein